MDRQKTENLKIFQKYQVEQKEEIKKLEVEDVDLDR
jgi:hypothetical protein